APCFDDLLRQAESGSFHPTRSVGASWRTGGLRYSPTTSTSFSSKRLSLDSLKVSVRCGCSPRADQMRCTVALLTPCALASDRQLQCVSPSGGSCNVAGTIAATL